MDEAKNLGRIPQIDTHCATGKTKRLFDDDVQAKHGLPPSEIAKHFFKEDG